MKTPAGLGLALVLSLTSCQVAEYDLRAEPQVPLADPGSPVTRTVDGGGWSHYLFWGLLPIGTYSPNAELETALNPGESVGAVTVEESNSFGAGFVALLTAGLYRPRSVSMVANVHGGGR